MITAFRAVMPELPPTEAWLPYLQESIEENWFTNFGPANKRFEERLSSDYAHDEEEVITTANATAGLSACLIAEAISGPVLCPAFTFQATASAILSANCKPFIIDVDPITGVVTPENLEVGFRNSGASAAIIVSPYGIQTDLRNHASLCGKLGKLLIVDNAAGLGVPRRMDYDNNTRDFVREVFSLHATKPFGIGEGGAIFAPTNKIPSLRAATNFGLQTHTGEGLNQKPYWGINGKLSDVHAAIGLAVAKDMSRRVALRQDMAARWLEVLQGTPIKPFSREIQKAPWQVFPVLLESHQHALAAVEIAAKRDIELKRYYAPSLGSCRGMESLNACPHAKDLAERVVALPIRSTMTPNQQEEKMTTIRDCILEGLEKISSD